MQGVPANDNRCLRLVSGANTVLANTLSSGYFLVTKNWLGLLLTLLFAYFSSDKEIKVSSDKTITVDENLNVVKEEVKKSDVEIPVVTYRSSGVIFEIVPEILRKTVNLQIRQEMSNFAETVNGVNGSPTLVKRELKTNVTASSGETLVLGGLIENKDTDSSAGLSFLPSWTGAKSNTKENTEILLMLYVEII